MPSCVLLWEFLCSCYAYVCVCVPLGTCTFAENTTHIQMKQAQWNIRIKWYIALLPVIQISPQMLFLWRSFVLSSAEEMFIDFRERGKYWLVASYTCPDWVLNLQPRYVHWPGIELAAFWCTGQHSNQLSHMVRVKVIYLVPCPKYHYISLGWSIVQ